MLQRKGYQCIPALVGSTSVDLPTAKNVCMVLLDYRLNSSLTAADVAAKLKVDFPSAPIIILSEMPWMPEDAQPYAKGFVHKGEPDRLLETVAMFCGQNYAATAGVTDCRTGKLIGFMESRSKRSTGDCD